MAKQSLRPARNTLSRLLQLGRDSSAVAMVEFAFAAPIVLAMGLLGTETAYFALTHMRVSQIAVQVADNASRLGDTEVLVAKKVYENDVNGVLVGAEKLGENIDIFEHGRIIISSLQDNGRTNNTNNGVGGQTIKWQRCRGAKVYDSSYGEEGVGKDNDGFPGMGSSPNPIKKLRSEKGTAVMFVEISYTYEPITPFEFYGDTDIQYTAAFNIRDSRDLTGLYQTNPESPVASCDNYSADRPS